MTSPSSRPPYVVPLLGLAVFLAIAITIALLRDPSPHRTVAKAPVADDFMATGPTEPVEFKPPTTLASAQLSLEVSKPEALRTLVRENAWLQEVVQTPLGKGFASGWSAFLGSRGEDLKASFKGALAEVVLDELLADPFRISWFVEGQRSGAPAIIVPEVSTTAAAAFGVIDQAVRRGTLLVKTCPAPEDGEAAVLPGEGAQVARWLVADHPVFAARLGTRMVLARSPLAVIHGLCSAAPPVKGGSDLTLTAHPDGFGRDAQVFAHALGLDGPLSLGMNVKGKTLEPTGLTAALTRKVLEKGALSANAMKVIPEETTVLLSLTVVLPQTLDTPSLSAFLGSKGKVEGVARQVALAWTPRGDRNLPTEVAIVWSRVEDAAALGQLFTGANKPLSRELCGQVVLASTSELLGRMARACAGQQPNLANAAPAVKAGWSAPSSVGVGIHVGKLLSQLALDGYWSDSPVDPKKPLPRTAPPEIEAARRTLESLPYFGFTGKAEGNALVGGGFRS